MDILEIDRIVLEGLDVAARQGNELRELIEKSLQRRLEEKGVLNGLIATEISVLKASGMNVNPDQSNEQVADGLTRQIVQGMRGIAQTS